MVQKNAFIFIDYEIFFNIVLLKKVFSSTALGKINSFMYVCSLNFSKTPMTDVQSSIKVCACVSRSAMNRQEIIRLVSALKNAGYQATILPDLCKVAVSDATQMAKIASATVVACYPRAVRALFDSLGLKPARVFNIRNQSSEQVLVEMGVSQPIFLPELPFPEIKPDEGWEAWYPVIDAERCTQCGKCHDFCLFGVYAVENGTVKVKQPQNCKNNCPACARVCPSKAIIFPKYEKSPVNGGLNDEEPFIGADVKVLYNTALKHKLVERRAKVSLLRKNFLGI